MHITSIFSITILTCSIMNPHLSVAMEKQGVGKISDTHLTTQQSPTSTSKSNNSPKKEEPKPTPIAPPIIEDQKTMQSLKEIHKLNTTQRNPVSDKAFRMSVKKTLDDGSELTRQEGKAELIHVIAFNNIKCHYSAMKISALSNRQWTRRGTFAGISVLSLFGARQIPNPLSSKTAPTTSDSVGIDEKKIAEKTSSKLAIGAVETLISVAGGIILGLIFDEVTQYINDEGSKLQKINNETKPWEEQSARINQAMHALSPEDSENIKKEAHRLTEEYMKKYPTPIKLVQEDDNRVYVIRDGKLQDIKLNAVSQ